MAKMEEKKRCTRKSRGILKNKVTLVSDGSQAVVLTKHQDVLWYPVLGFCKIPIYSHHSNLLYVLA